MDLTKKGKTTEGKGLTGYRVSKSLPLTGPSSLVPSKPLSPIRETSSSNKPRKMHDGEEEKGNSSTAYRDIGRSNQEESSGGKGHKTSFLYSTEGEMKKASLGLPLIPPIRKAGSLSPDSAAGSLPRSPQVDLQESQEMRPGSSSRRQEKSLEHAESSESTRKTQRKEEKSSHCKTGPVMPLFPRELTDPFSLEIHVLHPGLGNGGLYSWPAQGALVQEPQEYGSASQKDLTGYSLTKRFSLVGSDVLLPTKSLSPVQKNSLSSKIREKLPTD